MVSTQRTEAQKNTPPAQTSKAPDKKIARITAKEIETQAEEMHNRFHALLTKNADQKTRDLLLGYSVTACLMNTSASTPPGVASPEGYQKILKLLKFVMKILKTYDEQRE